MYRTCGICKDPSGAHIKEDINMKRPVTAAIAGLGNRGNDIYAHYQLVAPEEMKVVAVADPVAGKREAAREEYGVAPENCFETVEDLLKQPKLADILVIATQDKQHVAQAVEAISHSLRKAHFPKPGGVSSSAENGPRIWTYGSCGTCAPLYSILFEDKRGDRVRTDRRRGQCPGN